MVMDTNITINRYSSTRVAIRIFEFLLSRDGCLVHCPEIRVLFSTRKEEG